MPGQARRDEAAGSGGRQSDVVEDEQLRLAIRGSVRRIQDEASTLPPVAREALDALVVVLLGWRRLVRKASTWS